MTASPWFWLAYTVAAALIFYAISGIWMAGPGSLTAILVSFVVAFLLIAAAEVMLE